MVQINPKDVTRVKKTLKFVVSYTLQDMLSSTEQPSGLRVRLVKLKDPFSKRDLDIHLPLTLVIFDDSLFKIIGLA